MTEAKITHRCEEQEVPRISTILETSTENGVKCEWSGYSIFDANSRCSGMSLMWLFDWSELRAAGVDGLSGNITVTSSDLVQNDGKTVITVDLTEMFQTVNHIIRGESTRWAWEAEFEYTLIPRRSTVKDEEVSYEEMFLPSELNDTVLVIDGKKLHVHKGFLSIHSEFFRALFSSNFKEGKMNEIPIRDITFEEFGLLMSTIYPETVYPNDKTVEKLLELADRFIIPAVIRHVQHHLLHISNISHEKKTWMADQYKMPKLFEKCLREINNLEKYKKLAASPEYKKLSKNAKADILDRLNQFL